MIATEDDLGRAHERLASFGWFHFAVEDRTRCAWLIHEHEDGELYATMGGDWQRASALLAKMGPLVPLQDLSLNYVAARRQFAHMLEHRREQQPVEFGRKAAQFGEPTDLPLAEVLAAGTVWHRGRLWSGHSLEDECPCPQEPCGLVSTPVPECDQNAELARGKARGCGRCAICHPDWRGMYVCVTCGNKRCPHATDCRHACTGSNEPGQRDG